ncbi:MAG: hypothetical protein ACLVDB_09815 [Anaeromassilibacillus sp.]
MERSVPGFCYPSEHPLIYIRLNNTKGDEEYLLRRMMEENVKVNTITWIPHAAVLEASGSVSSLDSFQEGLFHVQDLSSQLCATLLEAKPEERVLDVCAAPGGKTFTIAEQMENSGEVLAFDQYKGKVRLIREGAKRLGLTCIHANSATPCGRNSLWNVRPCPLRRRVLIGHPPPQAGNSI